MCTPLHTIMRALRSCPQARVFGGINFGVLVKKLPIRQIKIPAKFPAIWYISVKPLCVMCDTKVHILINEASSFHHLLLGNPALPEAHSHTRNEVLSPAPPIRTIEHPGTKEE